MDFDRSAVLLSAGSYARDELGGDGGGHDWWHVHRVRNLAVRLAAEEGADLFITELAALLHDIADYKLSGSVTAGAQAARSFCSRQGLLAEDVEHVVNIVADLSFKGAGVPDATMTLEGRCVRDADRLDAMGAIGIGRAFAYGGQVSRPLWEPDRSPDYHDSEMAYRRGSSSTIDHFHEKLLLLESRITTEAGRKLARHRHLFLVAFLEEFASEWDGRDGETGYVA